VRPLHFSFDLKCLCLTSGLFQLLDLRTCEFPYAYKLCGNMHVVRGYSDHISVEYGSLLEKCIGYFKRKAWKEETTRKT